MDKKHPFIIINDTREQRPYKFPEWDVEVKTLNTGDISIKGAENLITLDRKDIGDFVSCCGSGRDRFKRELERMKGYRFSAILIETTMLQLMRGAWRGKVQPSHVLGSIASWSVKYKVHFFFVTDHASGEAFSLYLLRKFYDYCSDFANTFRFTE